MKHQLNPGYELENYDPSQLEPEFRGGVHQTDEVIRMVKKTMPAELKMPTYFTDEEVADLVAFLKSMTSPSARKLEHLIPEAVPSGLEMVQPFPLND